MQSAFTLGQREKITLILPAKRGPCYFSTNSSTARKRLAMVSQQSLAELV